MVIEEVDMLVKMAQAVQSGVQPRRASVSSSPVVRSTTIPAATLINQPGMTHEQFNAQLIKQLRSLQSQYNENKNAYIDGSGKDHVQALARRIKADRANFQNFTPEQRQAYLRKVNMGIAKVNNARRSITNPGTAWKDGPNMTTFRPGIQYVSKKDWDAYQQRRPPWYKPDKLTFNGGQMRDSRTGFLNMPKSNDDNAREWMMRNKQQMDAEWSRMTHNQKGDWLLRNL